MNETIDNPFEKLDDLKRRRGVAGFIATSGITGGILLMSKAGENFYVSVAGLAGLVLGVAASLDYFETRKDVLSQEVEINQMVDRAVYELTENQ